MRPPIPKYTLRTKMLRFAQGAGYIGGALDEDSEVIGDVIASALQEAARGLERRLSPASLAGIVARGVRAEVDREIEASGCRLDRPSSRRGLPPVLRPVPDDTPPQITPDDEPTGRHHSSLPPRPED